MVKISIIVPVYNTEAYLMKCLNSLINQTIEEKEIIIIDDGSTDNSLKIIKAYQRRYPDIIKVIESKNEGPGAARNKGLAIAQGEFIGFVDSDDYVEFDMFEYLYNGAVSHGVSTAKCEIGEHVGFLNFGLLKSIFNKRIDKCIDFKKEPNHFVFEGAGSCTKIFKKSLINKRQFPEGTKWEDVAFIMPLLCEADKVLFMSQVKYQYYYHLKSTTIKDVFHPNENIVDIFQVNANLRDQLKARNLEELFGDMINIREQFYTLSLMFTILPWKKVSFKDKKELLNAFNKLLIKKYGDYNNPTFMHLISNNPLLTGFVKYINKYLVVDTSLQSEGEIKEYIKSLK